MAKHGDIRHIYPEDSFRRFHQGEFQDMLETVVIPRQGGEDFSNASWDRKAAWLLWCERQGIALTFKGARRDDDII